MPLIAYKPQKFGAASMAVIDRANAILAEYAESGYDLTLRQLYYQFVARSLLANKDTEYKRLGGIISDARMAGLIDWDRIVDRTRNLRELSNWDSPQEIVEATAKQFRHDKWANQENYVEVWVEKDALVGVMQVACEPLDVPYFSCRGYTSQSEMWSASQRLLTKIRDGKRVTIIHLGDHDPSGKDMTRDVDDRIMQFIQHHRLRDLFEKELPGLKAAYGSPERREEELRHMWMEQAEDYCPYTVDRIALNMAQIEEYNPPPNPAKITDSRARAYMDEFGESSWELDALPPDVLTTMIRDKISELRDADQWALDVEREDIAKEQLAAAARWIEDTNGNL